MTISEIPIARNRYHHSTQHPSLSNIKNVPLGQSSVFNILFLKQFNLAIFNRLVKNDLGINGCVGTRAWGFVNTLRWRESQKQKEQMRGREKIPKIYVILLTGPFRPTHTCSARKRRYWIFPTEKAWKLEYHPSERYPLYRRGVELERAW